MSANRMSGYASLATKIFLVAKLDDLHFLGLKNAMLTVDPYILQEASYPSVVLRGE